MFSYSFFKALFHNKIHLFFFQYLYVSFFFYFFFGLITLSTLKKKKKNTKDISEERSYGKNVICISDQFQVKGTDSVPVKYSNMQNKLYQAFSKL